MVKMPSFIDAYVNSDSRCSAPQLIEDIHMDIETSYNFRRIDERLTTSGVVPEEGLTTLATQGYEAVINLLPETSEFAVPNERGLVESQGIEYIHIPVDFKHPTQTDFAKFSEALDRVRDKKTHIHCAANYRVSAFYSLYEFKRGNWSAEQAREFIGDIWQPVEHPGWDGFINGLLALH
jgi:protein tyrosine phosphatase (PTP) superfamily phosphohydrolase (DUF442 family)